ncbi:hypothetical protein CXU22_08170 [Akkermansia muciniphila]|uniref:Uncharacterized protein n=1 Tax=Akkermansia muciniphila TaxID=239935 RepID=A0A2N8HCV3_9BACT|nr:hypothetical protein CXU22_08170 [Akkermansia muciniphila]
MKNSGLPVCQGEGNEHAGASINAADIAIIIYSEATCRQFFDFHDVVQENAAFHQFFDFISVRNIAGGVGIDYIDFTGVGWIG